MRRLSVGFVILLVVGLCLTHATMRLWQTSSPINELARVPRETRVEWAKKAWQRGPVDGATIDMAAGRVLAPCYEDDGSPCGDLWAHLENE